MPRPTVSPRRAVAVLALASVPLICASYFTHPDASRTAQHTAVPVAAAHAVQVQAVADNSVDGLVTEPAARPFEVVVSDESGNSTVGRPSTYRITVRNVSGTRYPQARITQSLGEGTRFVRAAPEGRAAARLVTWTLDLPPGATRTIDVTTVPSNPKGLAERQLLKTVQGSNDASGRNVVGNVATIVCAGAGAADPSPACGTDVDVLAAAPLRSTGASPLEVVLFVVLGGGLAAGAALYLRRRPTPDR